MTTNISDRLREETRELHTIAERSGIMRPLLRGTLSPAGYAVLLRNLRDIYVAMERGLDARADDAVLAPFSDRGLRRSMRLEADLDAIAGNGWRATSVAASTSEYVNRLASMADAHPSLLLAHAYVRYLGDLSGGQHIARIVRRVLPAEMAGATTFYEFPEIGVDLNTFKDTLRAAMDAIPLTQEEASAIVEEAKWGFRAHAVMFDELAVVASTDATLGV